MENWLNSKSTYSVIPLFRYSLFRVLQIPQTNRLHVYRRLLTNRLHGKAAELC